MHTDLSMHTEFNGKGKESNIIMRKSKKKPQSVIFRRSNSFGFIIIKTLIIYNGRTRTVCLQLVQLKKKKN